MAYDVQGLTSEVPGLRAGQIRPNLNPVHIPSSPLRSRSQLNQLGGSGGALWAPPVGSGAEPRPKTNLVHSKAVRKPLVAIIQYRRHLSGVQWRRRSVAQGGAEPARPPLNLPLGLGTTAWRHLVGRYGVILRYALFVITCAYSLNRWRLR